MEKLGVPAAVICTEPFVSSGKAMALAHGYTDYPFAVIPHPINITTPQQLKAWSEEVLSAVENLLMSAG